MNRSGRAVLLALLLGLLPAVASALEATVDRYRVNLGDSLTLTLRATGGADPAAAELSALERDFEILQRSTSTSTRIVNGRSSRERTLELEITPLREGTLAIPSLTMGSERTAPLAIEVTPSPTLDDPDAEVIFSAEVDSDRVYVQQQLLLTLRIQQAIALDDRSVTELDLDNAFVKALGQNSFQRDDGQRRWLVHEIRYAIFPEQSGTLEIPAQTFAARVRQGSRSLFDLRSGPRISRRSQPLRVTVQPRPAAFPGDNWLPATELTVEESWSREPDSLATGESITRTVTVTGAGLQGAQLPPISYQPEDGLKYYPDQAQIEDAEGAGGVIGMRTDSAAIVPVAPGSYRLPALRIPWWDTEEDRLRYATLPGRDLQVTPAAAPAGTAPEAATPGEENGARSAAAAAWWPLIAAGCAAGWLATAFLWWRQRQSAPAPSPGQDPGRPQEAAAWRALRAALAARDPGHCRACLDRWLRTLPGAPRDGGVLHCALALETPALATAVVELDAALFGPHPGPWDPGALDSAARELRQRQRRRGGDDSGNALPPLYPDTGMNP